MQEQPHVLILGAWKQFMLEYKVVKTINTKAEILTAILLLYTCKHPDADLGKLRIDLVKGFPQLGKVLLGDKIDGVSVV